MILHPQQPRRLGLVAAGSLQRLGQKHAVGLICFGSLQFRIEGRLARFAKRAANFRYLWSIGALALLRRQRRA